MFRHATAEALAEAEDKVQNGVRETAEGPRSLQNATLQLARSGYGRVQMTTEPHDVCRSNWGGIVKVDA